MRGGMDICAQLSIWKTLTVSALRIMAKVSGSSLGMVASEKVPSLWSRMRRKDRLVGAHHAGVFALWGETSQASEQSTIPAP